MNKKVKKGTLAIDASEDFDFSNEVIEKEVEMEFRVISRLDLLQKFPVSSDDANLSHKNDWGHECRKFADSNNLHFLGFNIKSDEPMFKAK